LRTKRAAEAFEAGERTDQGRGAWIDPNAGQISLETYSTSWLAARASLRPGTRELYDGHLKNHILPTLGDVELSRLTTERVRCWHAGLLAAGMPGEVTVAKCYRLLRTILATAVEDGLIVKNPCNIRNAAVEHSPERRTATIGQIGALADSVGDDLRLMVLLGTYTTLRLGELLGLERRHIDIDGGTVDVVQQAQELRSGQGIVGPPKTSAGVRTVTIPESIRAEVAAHLAARVGPAPDAVVFTGADGMPLRRKAWTDRWHRAREEVGLPEMHFHDCRHTGSTLAAASGATTKELMRRMGHASPRAALIYQHATRDRDAAIAAALSDLIDRGRPPASEELRSADDQPEPRSDVP